MKAIVETIRIGDIVKPSKRWIIKERHKRRCYNELKEKYLRNDCFGTVAGYGFGYCVEWINVHPLYGAPYNAWWEPDELELVEHGLYEKYKREL